MSDRFILPVNMRTIPVIGISGGPRSCVTSVIERLQWDADQLWKDHGFKLGFCPNARASEHSAGLHLVRDGDRWEEYCYRRQTIDEKHYANIAKEREADVLVLDGTLLDHSIQKDTLPEAIAAAHGYTLDRMMERYQRLVYLKSPSGHHPTEETFRVFLHGTTWEGHTRAEVEHINRAREALYKRHPHCEVISDTADREPKILHGYEAVVRAIKATLET